MQYDIRMSVTYRYPVAATAGRHLLRIMPSSIPGEQRLDSCRLLVEPDPVEWHQSVDFFGNRTDEVALDSPHTESRFEMSCRVERMVEGQKIDISPRPEDLPREIAAQATLASEAPHHFLGNSPRITLHPAMTTYGQKAARGAESVLEMFHRLGRAINADFTFDPTATEVDTPAIDAFERREGVCQDFTHVMISCLRGMGIPAGYVSGFLRTVPPEGQPRLEGADAMHAWVRAWCGERIGWVEYDPTNALDVANDHVVIARGRDYSDVAPVKGVMRIAGGQQTTQSVDVIPLGES
ncbi:transglutaminase family protein [Aliiruegeria lutimaris]|uniref:Transglutaminase-like enzyme, putative cysteine protease n=1 Tax=Aliiruegeria lutimaris TaxID=571298 RepID=A0A1G8YVJ2_9RHOB|nr:transglutaminase family protein [Aliiruegeria lutimaris]SDK06838.1 Transglutaminase-like enzyme, putative cysteine protease [Aliiruegeria lutimaris]